QCSERSWGLVIRTRNAQLIHKRATSKRYRRLRREVGTASSLPRRCAEPVARAQLSGVVLWTGRCSVREQRRSSCRPCDQLRQLKSTFAALICIGVGSISPPMTICKNCLAVVASGSDCSSSTTLTLRSTNSLTSASWPQNNFGEFRRDDPGHANAKAHSTQMISGSHRRNYLTPIPCKRHS